MSFKRNSSCKVRTGIRVNRNIDHSPDFIPTLVPLVKVSSDQLWHTPPWPCLAVRCVLAIRSRSLAGGMVPMAAVTEVVANERYQH